MRTHATTTEELRELVALSSFTGHAEARVLLANCAADLLAARAEIAALREAVRWLDLHRGELPSGMDPDAYPAYVRALEDGR